MKDVDQGSAHLAICIIIKFLLRVEALPNSVITVHALNTLLVAQIFAA